jgi:hypothetical protein
MYVATKHEQEAFCDWLDLGQPGDVTVWSIEIGGEQEWPAPKLLRELLRDDTPLPGAYCDAVQLPEGSTFGKAAETLLRQRREMIDG